MTDSGDREVVEMRISKEDWITLLNQLSAVFNDSVDRQLQANGEKQGQPKQKFCLRFTQAPRLDGRPNTNQLTTIGTKASLQMDSRTQLLGCGQPSALANQLWHSTTQLPIQAWSEDSFSLQDGALVCEHIANQLSMAEMRFLLDYARRHMANGECLHFAALAPKSSCEAHANWPGESMLRLEDSHLQLVERKLRQYIELARLFSFELRPTYPLENQSLKQDFGMPALDWLHLQFVKLPSQTQFYEQKSNPKQKYGERSDYRRFDRLEEAEILDDWIFAAQKLEVEDGQSVLAIGVNDGRELLPLASMGAKLEFFGIDHSASAIEQAQAYFKKGAVPLARNQIDSSFEFLCADANQLDELEQLHGKTFDHILMLNVLQCTSIDRDQLLSSLNKFAHKKTSYLVSIPNCHFGYGDILRRPLDRRDRRQDRSLIHKDARFLTRHFYRKGLEEVLCFGTYDLFVLAK